MATSETTPFEVLINVFSLEQLLENKKKVLRQRSEPRDLFDLWFLSQRLKKEVDIPSISISEKRLKSELHKFLPKNYWSVLKELGQYAKV